MYRLAEYMLYLPNLMISLISSSGLSFCTSSRILFLYSPPRVGGVEIVGRFDAGGQHGDQFQVAVAMFCREKVWWNNSELVMEELFVRPECQRQGFGTALLQKAEEYVIDKGLAGITLVTNRCAPAPAFYKKNGFAEYGHVLYMGKEAQPRPDNQPS